MKRAVGAELWKSDVPWPINGRECHLVGHGGEGTGWAHREACRMGSVILI